MSMKYVENEISNYLSQKKEQKHNPNYHFCHLWSDPDENLKNKNWC